MSFLAKASATIMNLSGTHTVKKVTILEVPEGFRAIQFGMGCFWGAERRFWELKNVYSTAVGYAGGANENPTYNQVCTGQTKHVEVVLVIYDPKAVELGQLLQTFWESHDPTQGDRQGNDRGSQYRSVIYVDTDQQLEEAMASKKTFQKSLKDANINKPITTEITKGKTFFYAEEYHQQYLDKNPLGYCGLKGTGVSCPIPKKKK